MLDQFLQKSINDYLDLPHREWFVEFDSTDFGVSLPSILELPSQVYEMNQNIHFLAFIKRFLEKCEINFILRRYDHTDLKTANIELALIGWWFNKPYAIPLLFLKNMLLGFEIIPSDEYIILDSEPLTWTVPVIVDSMKFPDNKEYSIMVDTLIFEHKLCLKIESGHIAVNEFIDELKFFERISKIRLMSEEENGT